MEKELCKAEIELRGGSEKRQRQEMPNNHELLSVIFITSCISVLNWFPIREKIAKN